MATRVNINGIHELQFSLPGTTAASIASPGVVSLSSAGFNGLNPQTADYTLQSADNQKLVRFDSASAVTATLPQPGTSSIDGNFAVWIANSGTGAVSINPTSSAIDGNATLTLTQNEGVILFTDGINYFTVRGMGTGGGGGTAPIFGAGNPFGTNVPSVVQNTSVTSGTTVTTTSSVTAGNLLLVVLSAYLPNTPVTCTDNLGTSYTSLAYIGNTSGKIGVWVGVAPTSGICTVTIGGTGTTHEAIGIAEFHNATTTLDGTVATNTLATASTTNTTSLTTSVANDLLITCYGDNYGNNTGSLNAGWTTLFFNQGADWVDLGLAYQIGSSVGPYTATWTVGASTASYCATFALKAASTPVAGTEGQLYFDTTNASKFAGYVYHSGQWNDFS